MDGWMDGWMDHFGLWHKVKLRLPEMIHRFYALVVKQNKYLIPGQSAMVNLRVTHRGLRKPVL
jgi:hypothetical protein